MTESPAGFRSSSLREHLPAWLVVHHLLSAEMLRELVSTMVDEVSGGKLSLQDLFEETSHAGTAALGSWAIVTRPTESELASHLSRLTLAIVWRGDDVPFLSRDGLQPVEAAWLETLNKSLSLSSADLTIEPEEADDEGRVVSLGKVVEALATARRAADESRDVVSLEDSVAEIVSAWDGWPPVLAGLMAKHVGDLCADLDRWDLARSLYEEAVRSARKSEEPAWAETVNFGVVIAAQSLAMATWHLEGAEAAAGRLEDLVDRATLQSAPIGVLNANFDLLNAHAAAGSFATMANERRASVVDHPLLIHSLRLDNALDYSSAERFREAHRWFWATLRRQVALGGTAVSRLTKAKFGQSMIREVEATLDRQRRPEAFAMGVRLLVEGARTEVIKMTTWSPKLVEAFVDENMLRMIDVCIARAPGMRQERTMAAATLHREWLKAMPGDVIGPARTMMASLASLAVNGVHSGFTDLNTAGYALKALKEVGSGRPEFRRLLGAELPQLLEATIGKSGPVPVSEAIEVAEVFIDGVEPEVAKDVALRTIDLVSGLPSEAFWPITHAAMRLLSGDTPARIAASDEEFDRRRTGALVRLALNSREEHASLMYLLRDVNPSAIEEKVESDKLRSIVSDLRERSKDTNSSAATACIHALLVAPRIAGPDGVSDALTGLAAIVGSAGRKRPSPSLVNAYDPLLLVAETLDRIVAESGLDADDLRRCFVELSTQIEALWRAAAVRPLVFTSFSIPPRSSPDATAVHNWTFATLEFARAMGTPGRFDPALDDAAENGLLGDRMAVARAIQANASRDLEASALAVERADAFYAALGQRLVAIAEQSEDWAAKNSKILLDRCMEVGPRGEDAGLLLTAHRLGLRLESANPAVADYVARVRREPQLRLSLTPLVRSVLRLEAD